jgi:hypothetical protein
VIVDVFKAVQLPSVAFAFGSEHLERNDLPPPSIVWAPIDGDFTAGKVQANRVRASETRNSVGTAMCMVRARIWGRGTVLVEGEDQSMADTRATWDLLRRFLVAVYDMAAGSFRVQRMRWLAEQGDSLVEYGKAVDVDLEFDFPVYRDATDTATPTIAEAELELDNPETPED